MYPNKDKVRIFITTVDYIYWVFIPNILKYPFQSRKHIDFIQWIIVVYMKKHGLLKTNHQWWLELLTLIKDNMNKHRYSNNKVVNITTILNVLNMGSIYDITKSHDINYRHGRYLGLKKP